MPKLNSILSGVAGAYFAAGELTRQGYIASLTLRNTKGIDVLVSNESASRSVGIQVKTNQGSAKIWLMHEKAENYHADNLFYVFVNLNNGGKPDFFVVPSKVVADYITKSHQRWLGTPGRKGQKHKDRTMRQFKDLEGNYSNRWNLLGL